MRVRGLLIGTAIVSSILGAVVVYLVLTVPNDIKSAALLRQARSEISAHRNDRARDSLAKIIQQFPRTDAAAAATVALAQLENEERTRLDSELGTLRRALTTQATAVANLQQTVETIRNTPPPPPPVVEKPPPPPKKAPAKKPARKSTRRRR